MTQENKIIRAILKFVDEKGNIPGNVQLFEAMDKEISKDEITEFIRKENNRHCNPNYSELIEIKKKFDDKRKTGFGKNNGKRDEKIFLQWAKQQPNWNDKDEQKWLNEYNNGKFGFGTFQNFYEWYIKEPKKCCYCEITQDELKCLWKEKHNLLSSKKFTEALHIERLDANKPYCKDNCRLACAVCNNAKSDMISEQDFRKCFVEGIKKFYNLSLIHI